MEGPGESESEMGKEQFFIMLCVMPVLLIAWKVFAFGVNSWLLIALLVGYLFWVQKQFWATERRRIQFEERKKINAKRAMTEGETLRWLNTGLKVMWPICMERFASQHFFKPMAPWFLHKYKPKFVSKVTLLSLHLGNTPPDFRLIRALPSSQNDKEEVVFVAALEFSCDKDMSAQMTVQIKGIKTTFYISNLYIKGTVKFSVKFVKDWPVVGRVRFSFANTPIVNMTARPYNKNGMDMRFIPGAANWLEETLGTALEQSVVEPYMLVIDMEKLVSDMMYPPRPQQGPQAYFSVEHKSGFSPTVLVEILEAGELKAATGAGLPDPVVEVTLGAHKEKTKTITKTINPTWTNEVQRISIVNWELPNLLTLRVMSKPKTYTAMGRQTELGICSISVKDYRDGLRHVLRLPLENNQLENVSTGWIRFAITVDHYNNHTSQPGVEKPHASAGSQPTTQDIQTVSPPDSATTRKASVIHTRNSSTEDAGLVPIPQEPELEDVGSSEFIKMPYGGDGAFSIQCPGKEETLHFPPDPAPTSSRKFKGASGNDKGIAFDSKDRDADSKVKRSMRSILGLKKRSTSKVSNEIPPPEREMTFSEHSGYSSSLERSAELKVYHGALRMNLQLSPDMASRDAPDVDIHYPLETLKLETVLSQDPELIKTPDNVGHSTGKSKQLESTIELETDTDPQSQVIEVNGNSGFPSISSLREELNSSPSSSQRHQPLPEKQNSKNSWWKNLTKRSKRRKGRGSRPDDVPNNMDPLFQPGDYETYYPSDTSASQSFRKEPDENLVKALRLHHDYNTTTENSSILSCGRSQSCRQDSTNVKIVHSGGQSLRFDSSSLLNTIHERQGLDRPQHD